MSDGDKTFNSAIEGSSGFVIGETVTLHNMTVNQAQSPAEEAKRLFEIGKKYLGSCSYGQAEKALRSSLDKSADNPEVGYYLALAMLAGRRPRTLHRKQVLEIEELMRPCIASNEREYQHLLFLAFAKSDYYPSNGQSTPAPSPSEILSLPVSKPLDHDELAMLTRYSPPIVDFLAALFQQPD
ncbi:MAG: hypothetical protein HC897_17300 [Thermoanaerobaculia bacterium]|nr:hypothetical protein [Thermoanaerobaculia bacterium]